MKTLNRYIALIFLKNCVLSLVALSTLFLFQGILGDIFDRVYSGDQIVVYYLLNLPKIVVQMMGPSVLLATVFTLSGLARTNELVACFSVGVGVKQLAMLFLSIVFIFSCLVLIMEDRILPPTFKKRTSYYWREMRKRPDFFLDIKQDKIWYRSQDLIFNLKRFDAKEKTIHGMSVYSFDDDFRVRQVVDAERAEFTAKGWRLMDGTVTIFPPEEAFPQTTRFKEKAIEIEETPHDFQEIDKEVDGLRLKELYSYIKRMKRAGADTSGYEVKLHSRISLSFIPMVMCAIGIPFSMRGRRSGGVARDLGLCLAVTFFYWLFYSVGLSLGTNGALPPWVAAWFPSVVFMGLAAMLMSRRR
jgi:lipopolysaccharide export system permease protein